MCMSVCYILSVNEKLYISETTLIGGGGFSQKDEQAFIHIITHCDIYMIHYPFDLINTLCTKLFHLLKNQFVSRLAVLNPLEIGSEVY